MQAGPANLLCAQEHLQEDKVDAEKKDAALDADVDCPPGETPSVGMPLSLYDIAHNNDT